MLHIDTRMHTLALLPPLFSLVLAQLFSRVSSKHSYSILCACLSFCSAEASGCCHKCNSKSLALCFCRSQPHGPSLELREMLSRTPRSAAHRPVSVPLRCHVKQRKLLFFPPPSAHLTCSGLLLCTCAQHTASPPSVSVDKADGVSAAGRNTTLPLPPHISVATR